MGPIQENKKINHNGSGARELTDSTSRTIFGERLFSSPYIMKEYLRKNKFLKK